MPIKGNPDPQDKFAELHIKEGCMGYLHSQKRIMKPFAFTKPHDFRVFTK